MESIHNIVDSIHTKMFREQFGKDRYAFLFMPGDYCTAGVLKVPYYVHMAGLGKTPYEVKVSNIHTPAPLANDNGTCTFWRSVENLSVIGPESYEESETFLWAVSQAAPIRRVYSERTVKNQWKYGWVSGGFTADCVFMAPGTKAAEINRQLRKGKHILFQPGMYEIEEPIHITRPGTIVMGLGFTTLIPAENNPESALVIDDVDGVTVCALLFDAHYSSRTLLRADGGEKSHAGNPTVLSDLFFRVGGFRSAPVNVDCAVEIDANDVIGDHFWIWRADHGVPDSVGWDVNTSKNGLLVKGDDIMVYGLFNEHFQEYQTLWEGERGKVFFYQCETPYDAIHQERYMSVNGTRAGYAAYKIDDNVNIHEAYGLGIYDVFFKTDIRLENSMEVPEKPGIRIYHVCNDSLSDAGPRGIGYVINGKVPSTYGTYKVFRPWIDEFVGGDVKAHSEPYQKRQ